MNTYTEDSSPITSDAEVPDAPVSTNESASAVSDEPQVAIPELDGIVEIEFLDLTLQPIPELKYRFEFDGQQVFGKSDTSGRAQRLTDIVAGTLIDIYVFREHFKDYKQVGTICGTGGQCGFSIVSPKLRFVLDTEPHEGDPGVAEESKPPVPQNITNENQVTGVQATAPAALPPAKPPTSGTSARAKKEPAKIEQGRNNAGNPQATIIPPMLDNFFKAVSPMYHLWSWWSTRRSQITPTTEPKTENKRTATNKKSRQATAVTEAAPHQAINPVVALSQIKGTPLSAENKKYLDALFSYAEAQVLIDYSEYKGGTVSDKIVTAVNSHPPRQSPSKSARESKGMCFAYVRVALHEARFVNATTGNSQARNAGIDLLAEKFQDVSASLPQVSISYPGGYSEKTQSRVDSINTKHAATKAQAKKEKWSAEKTKAELERLDHLPEPDGVSHTQPDLMHTLPGDIIVYKQVIPHDAHADGHIDIRTYHGFVSDFVWGVAPKLGGPKPAKGKQYRVVGVYRKVSDEMAMVRVMAFLRILRELETEGYSDNESYFVLPDAKDPVTGKLVRRKFSNSAMHPFSEDVPIKYDLKDYYGNKNTAAGAYQIKLKTWQDTLKSTGWPQEFTANMQNRIAIYLLQQRPIEAVPHPRRSALGYIMEGDIEKAINKTSLWNEWACLPGGPHKAKITMNDLKSKFTEYEKRGV